MNSRSKRFLLTASVALLVAAAGCSGVLGSSETTVLLVNDDDGETHDVTVEILHGENTVFEESATTTGESNEELGTFDMDGEYTVAVTVDGNTTEESYTFEGGGTLSIGIGNDGTVTIGG